MPPQVATPVRPTPPRIQVRVYGAMWQGALPSDEAGPWQLAEAPTIVANLNAAMSEVPLTFELDQVLPLPVQELRFAMVAATRDEAALAFTHYAMAGRLSNDALAVVVVHPNPSSWVQGWGNIDQPLRAPGSSPIMAVSTRVARSREAHFIAHEFGHVVGFFDTTYYDPVVRENPVYTRCGLSIRSATYPLESAPPGAKQNLMSFNVEQRRSFFSDGYAEPFRSILDCWLRASRL
jgi:hypothetical protein